jgi:rod shape-determining protein MreD
MERIVVGRLVSTTLPVLLGLIGVVITNLPVSIFGNWVQSPMYALMPVYYWCLVRPDLMTPWWAFLIGLSHDIISGEHVGIWAASFVATYALVDKQRDAFAGLSGWGAVLGFATAALVACLTDYAINAIYEWQILPVSGSIKIFAVTSLMYAVVLPLLGLVHRKLVGPLRSEF